MRQPVRITPTRSSPGERTPGAPVLRFHLWGLVSASRGGEHADLGPARQRCVFAVLLMSPGQPVAVDALGDAVWGGNPPTRARNVLATYASRLRQALNGLGETGPTGPLLRHAAGGYLMDAEPAQIDAHNCRLLSRRARQHAAAGRDEEAAQLFAEALSQCAGEPLAGLTGDWAVRIRRQLESERRAMLTDQLELELRLGRHEAMVPALADLAQRNPTDARLVGMFMLALYRSGRQQEALGAYRAAHRASVEDFGLEPSQRLQRLQRLVLHADPELDWSSPGGAPAGPAGDPGPAALAGDPGPVAVAGEPPPAGPASEPQPPYPPWPRPAQLPPAGGDLIGRTQLISRTSEAIADPRGARTVVVTGVPGAGKTALVVRVAQDLRATFPDGQLFANLAATGPEPADPSGILARFVRALGVAAGSVPADPVERAALYRSLLADQRILVVLDDAADESQLRPLLPPGPGCAVLISSRHRLSAMESATLVEVGVLDRTEAVALLGRTAGRPRVEAEPDASAEIGRLCGFLPLAIRVAGGRLAKLPGLTVAAFAAELGDERHRLDLLHVGDLDVRASFALSYQRLDEPGRRLWRRLGLLTATEVTSRLAAAALDTDEAAAQAVLDELVDTGLAELASVDKAGQRRYRVHDLLRLFARERAAAEEPIRSRRAAVRRVIRAQLAAVEHSADRWNENSFILLHGHPLCTVPRGLGAEPPGVDRLAWLEAERSNLVAAVAQAAHEGMAREAWHLAGCLVEFFDLRGHYDDWRRTHTAALAAVERAGDRLGEAVVRQGFGYLEMAQDNYERALSYLEQAGGLFDGVGATVGVTDCLASAAACHRASGRLDEAAACARRADRIAVAHGYLLGRTHARFELGTVLREHGRLRDAVRCLREALALATEGGYRRAQGIVLRALGVVHGRLGDDAGAIAYHEQARDLLDGIGDQLRSAYATHQIAEAHLRMGATAPAADLLRQCVEVFRAHDDRYGQALAIQTQAELHRRVGRPERAADDLRMAAQLWHRLAMPLWEARSLRDLGDIEQRTSDAGAAAASWTKALDILRRLGAPEAADVGERLVRVGAHPPG